MNLSFKEPHRCFYRFAKNDRIDINFRGKFLISGLLELKRNLEYISGPQFDGSKKLRFPEPGKNMDMCALLLFVNGVELIARVANGRFPKLNENRDFFIESCIKYFDLDKESADILWIGRNNIVHSFSLHKKILISWINQANASNAFSENGGYGLFCPPYAARHMDDAIEKLHDFLRSLSLKERRQRSEFIFQNFFFTAPKYW